MANSVRESILNSTKSMLGIVPEYTAFDDQLILLINTQVSKTWIAGK